VLSVVSAKVQSLGPHASYRHRGFAVGDQLLKDEPVRSIVGKAKLAEDQG
jgi:hypothetical protein